MKWKNAKDGSAEILLRTRFWIHPDILYMCGKNQLGVAEFSYCICGCATEFVSGLAAARDRISRSTTAIEV